MENLFSFLMYKIFGKRWILHTMREGYKVAVFTDQISMDLINKKIKRAENRIKFWSSKLDQEKKIIITDENKKEVTENIEEMSRKKEGAEKELRIKQGELEEMENQLKNDIYKRDFMKNYKL